MPLNILVRPEIKVNWVDSHLNFNEYTYKVVEMHRQHLAAAVFEPYNVELEERILSEGLKNPLIVLDNTKENWEEATLDLKNRCEYNPYADVLVVYGNQRLRILDHINHEFPIPCVVAKNHIQAIIIHNMLNN